MGCELLKTSSGDRLEVGGEQIPPKCRECIESALKNPDIGTDTVHFDFDDYNVDDATLQSEALIIAHSGLKIYKQTWGATDGQGVPSVYAIERTPVECQN